MPPQIALLLCFLFILYFIIMDSRREAGISRALWIPLTWIMISGSKLFSQWLNPGGISPTQEAYLHGSPIDRIVFSILLGLGLLILSKRGIAWSKILQSNAMLFLFFLYCGISILWSDYPYVSFKRWIKDIGNITMVLVILTDNDPVEAVKAMIRRCTYILIPLSVVLIKYYPYIGRIFTPWGGSEFVGVTTSKNMLGNLCLICGLFFFWNLLTIWRKKELSVDKKGVLVNVLFLYLILWLLIKINSVTSLGSLIIGVFILMGLPIIKRNIRYIGVYFFLVVFIFMCLQWSFDFLEISARSFGRDMTLTGRVTLWEQILDIRINPLIGTGYESFWLGDRLTKIWANNWWMPNQAHNGYLEVYLNLGFIGLFLITGVIVSAYRKIRKALLFDFDYGSFRMAFLIIILVYNLTEAAFKGIHIVWFVFLLIIIDLPRISQFSLKEPE